jgi:cytochrome b561
MLKNTSERYGLVSRILHWLSALMVIALFALGLWMRELDYYDKWYQDAPDLHRSFGVVLMLLTLMRILWFRLSPKPKALAGHLPFERVAATVSHYGLMVLLALMFVSGYLITTAKGGPLHVFNLVAIPSLVNGIDNLEDFAGEIHEYAAYVIIGLAVLHAAGALKHHFYDKDLTLLRMLGLSRSAQSKKPK